MTVVRSAGNAVIEVRRQLEQSLRMVVVVKRAETAGSMVQGDVFSHEYSEAFEELLLMRR